MELVDKDGNEINKEEEKLVKGTRRRTGIRKERPKEVAKRKESDSSNSLGPTEGPGIDGPTRIGPRKRRRNWTHCKMNGSVGVPLDQNKQTDIRRHLQKLEGRNEARPTKFVVIYNSVDFI